jgi:hypothetical protein
MVWIALLLIASCTAAGIEGAENSVSTTLPSEIVDGTITEVVHCLAGIFVSPFYALIYSIIFTLFDEGKLTFVSFFQNFGGFFVKNIKDVCFNWVPTTWFQV